MRSMEGFSGALLEDYGKKLDEQGNIENVEKEERDVSHRLVEECMLLANEMVATFMHKNKLPLISRVHPEPDEEDMLEFADFVRGLENARVDPFKIHQLQAFLEEIRGKPEAHMVNLVLLKSMKQAVYSATESGHFALALEHYAHFAIPTSLSTGRWISIFPENCGLLSCKKCGKTVCLNGQGIAPLRNAGRKKRNGKSPN